MTTPGSGRGQPPFDATAAEVIAAARGQQPRQFVTPPAWDQALGYERAELTDEERAEAKKAADAEAEICRYCIGKHRYPTSVACPRIAEADLDGDGKVTRVRFREDAKWQARVALLEDLHESEDPDGSS